MAMDIVKNLGQLKGAGDVLQRDFKPDWVLKSVVSAAKKFVFDGLQRDIDVPALAVDLAISEPDAQRIVGAIFAQLAKRY